MNKPKKASSRSHPAARKSKGNSSSGKRVGKSRPAKANNQLNRRVK